MSDAGNALIAAVRERSPRSPFISLRKAVERAKELQAEHDRHAVRVESAAAAWGYGAKSSGWRQTVATLLMYNILQDSGSGSDRKVQLTDVAWRYLVDERPDHREPLLKKMALAPPIMADLWSTWGAKPPGDAECRSQLRIERGFTEGAAQEMLAIYKDNIAFAKLSLDDITPASPEELDEIEEELGIKQPPPPLPSKPAKEQLMSGERELTTGMLAKGASFRLIVSGAIGVKEIDRLIQKLQIDKEILADLDDVQPTSPGDDDDDGYHNWKAGNQ